MQVVPAVSAVWLTTLVNTYGAQPRAVAGESDLPYPELGPLIDAVPPVRALSEIADQLWAVFAAPEPAEGASRLNAVLSASALVPVLSDQGQLHWWTAHHRGADLIRAGCATTLLAAVQEGGWQRLGLCAGADCVDVHLDQPGRPRRYCSPTCLNRARVRAYRQRQRPAEPSTA